MAFPTTPVLDDFIRGDEGPPPSASWENTLFPSTGGMVVLTNQLAKESAIRCSAFWITPPGLNYELFATVATRPADGSDADLNVARNSAADYDGYLVRLHRDDVGGDLFELRRWDNGSSALLDTVGVTFADGDALGLRRIGAALEGWYKPAAGAWTQLLSASDATYQIATAQLGLLINVDAAQLIRVEDFGGGPAVLESADLIWFPPVGAIVE